MSRFKDFSPRTISTGLLASFVGFASSFAIVLKGLSAVGASPEQASSGLLALSVAMGLGGIVLSAMHKMPISVAWSTPGAALLISTPAVDGGYNVAVGAFLICAALLTLCGLWKPLGRWVALIPTSLANAMLAGILLKLCLSPVQAIAQKPWQGLLIVVVWAVVARLNRLMAVPAAVAVAAIIIATELKSPQFGAFAPHLEWVAPQFSLAAMISIALPLFIVTMASQNIPGLAVLNVNGYKPAPGPLFLVTGLFSFLSAPFGGHAVNLSALAAALCAGEEAHPDPQKRYWAAIITGFGYIAFGLCAGIVTAFVNVANPILIEAVAGLALMGSFSNSISGALINNDQREAATLTFLVTASGLSFYGIGGAFWGLVAGGIMLGLRKWRG